MMAAPICFGDGEYESLHHRCTQSRPPLGYYDRHAPYSYYHRPRQSFSVDYDEYGPRAITRVHIHDPEPEGAGANARKRIAVACSRCRRRKIKCSGDPGDGTGCTACRSAGADVNACNFIRVGSSTVAMANSVEVLPQPGVVGSAPSANGHSEAGSTNWAYGHNLHSRPSLPTLHARFSGLDYNDQYVSPTVDYTYASSTIPRHDSLASSYGTLENYRSWGTTTARMSAPATTASYYDQSGYSFGSLSAPSHAGPSGRLPSVAVDSASSLNMDSLHSSLPIQAAQERRLPVPYTIQYPTTTYPPTLPSIPDMRPLGSISETRPPIHGIHSRNAMPWSIDTSTDGTRTAPYAPLPHVQANQQSREPVLGYQFSHAADTSQPAPTAPIPTVSEGYATTNSPNTLMPPPSYRYPSNSGPLPPLTSSFEEAASTPTPSSREQAAASLYSFSSFARDSATERPATSESGEDHGSSSGGSSSTISSNGGEANQHAYTTEQQRHGGGSAVPRHTDSHERLQRAATVGQRMSVSRLNSGGY